MNLLEYAGRFHPLAVHLPIGMLTLFFAVGLLIERKELISAYSIIRLWILLTAIAATFASISGYLISISGSYEAQLVNRHMLLGLSLTLATWIIWFKLSSLLNARRVVFNAAVIAVFVMLLITGHAGGTLTHGADFLTPPPVSAWFSGKPSNEVAINQGMIAGEAALLIFEQKCVSCHGGGKQKGKLRLDSREAIAKGGKNGALFDVEPAQGLMIKRLHLPFEDEEHMPPEGRKQLSTDELNFLSWWINKGATFDLTLAELNLPDSLHGLLNQEKSTEDVSFVPEQNVTQADQNAVRELAVLGVAVYPVAENSNYLSAHFLNVLPDQADEAIQLLEKIKEQLVWLRLDYQQLSAESWQSIAMLENLLKLSLKNTNATDSDLNMLQNHEDLAHLNLAATEVTIEGIRSMGAHPDLKYIFLYQTGIISADYTDLRALLPSTQIDTGNYQVPILASDTTVLTSGK